MKTSHLPPDDVILCNRSATYLGLKKYVPAGHDALQAAKANPDNWKAHWRHAVSIMALTPKRFRTKQALASLEKCLACSTLPDNKRNEVNEFIKKATDRLNMQDAQVPDLFVYVVMVV